MGLTEVCFGGMQFECRFVMRGRAFYVINGITLYRLITAPVLVILAFYDQYEWFRWMLTLSFFTDAIDGFLARKFKVATTFGARLDSIADDLTVLAGIVGVFIFKPEFIRENKVIIATLLILMLIQYCYSLIKYKKLSSFHTYSAKAAALAQGCFLILLFLLPQPIYPLFYLAAAITFIDLAEEIILVRLLDKWQSDVKGLYWVLKQKQGITH